MKKNMLYRNVLINVGLYYKDISFSALNDHHFESFR